MESKSIALLNNATKMLAEVQSIGQLPSALADGVVTNRRKSMSLRTSEIECAVVRYFNPRVNLIVPNVSWGFNLHECDLLIITRHGYAYEVEIKISKSDLYRDKYKAHKHRSERIKRLYFAIPETLLPYISEIPERAGIIVVNEHRQCRRFRKAQAQTKYKISEHEKFMLARLGTLRFWNLKL